MFPSDDYLHDTDPTGCAQDADGCWICDLFGLGDVIGHSPAPTPPAVEP